MPFYGQPVGGSVCFVQAKRSKTLTYKKDTNGRPLVMGIGHICSKRSELNIIVMTTKFRKLVNGHSRTDEKKVVNVKNHNGFTSIIMIKLERKARKYIKRWIAK